MCISIPVSTEGRKADSRLRTFMTGRPGLFFALGWLFLLALFLLLPNGPHSLAVLLADGLLLFALGRMAGAFQPMSPIRIGFGLWFNLTGGSLALLGGLFLVLGALLAAMGAYPIISEWRWRRFWLNHPA